MNNRVRGALAEALVGAEAACRRTSSERLAAAKALAGGADAAMLPLVRKAMEKETDPDIKALLDMTAAGHAAQERATRQTRLAAIRMLGASAIPNTKTLLLPKPRVRRRRGRPRSRRRRACARSRRASRWGEWLGLAFAGVSLGSILLLAALGLAITYGLMGVINMAHGELIMIGAYTTYVVQNLFRAHRRALRLVPARRGAGRVRRLRRWSAWRSSAASSAGSTAGRSRRCSRPGASA